MRLRGLRQARQRQGLSISQLAERADLRRERLTQLEQGQDDVDPSLMRRLASALGVSLGELIAAAPTPMPHAPV